MGLSRRRMLRAAKFQESAHAHLRAFKRGVKCGCATMGDLEKLQYLSLVSKICTEFENHLNLTDKVLAEFVIDLAEKHPSIATFNAALLENGAEFPEAFVANLYNIIQKMRPHKSNQNADSTSSVPSLLHLKQFPGLALPNGKPEWMLQDEEKYVVIG